MAESLDLCDAILGNSACLVELCLKDENKDPNARPKLTLLEDVLKDADGKVEDTERILGENADYSCAPIHVAVVNAYHNSRMDGIASKQRDGALKIVDLLLEAGADVSTSCNNVLFCNIGDLNISSPCAPLDPISLTLSLKKVKASVSSSNTIHSDECADMMDQVLLRLVKARKAQKRHKTPTVTMSAMVASTYRDLCLSKQYSDVQIECKDGVELPAHRNVLAAASPVMRIIFSKKNEESLQQQQLSVNRTSSIMKAVLQFIYTGQLEESTLESETATLLSVASEFKLEALEQLCAGKCGERLTIQNVRIMLDIGERHKARWIKKECLDFLQRQPLPVVLGHAKILALAKENPKLWQEILMAVGGGAGGPGAGAADYSHLPPCGADDVTVVAGTAAAAAAAAGRAAEDLSNSAS